MATPPSPQRKPNAEPKPGATPGPAPAAAPAAPPKAASVPKPPVSAPLAGRPAARPMAGAPASTAIRPATRPAPRPAGAGARPPPRAPVIPTAPAARRKPGWRVFWTFVIVGAILFGTGIGLEVGYLPLVAHAESASQFLVDAAATPSSDQAVSFVQFGNDHFHAGEAVTISDTVTAVRYNSTTGTTSLSFKSIQDLPSAQRGPQASLASNLFGTISGKLSWLSAGNAVVMTFTVVNAYIPAGGPYGAGYTYLTLDAAADATHTAMANGYSGPASVAVAPQYFQPNPSVNLDGLFFFLAAVGVVLILLGVYFRAPIDRWFRRQTKEPTHLPPIVMGITALFGGFFMPFYPWPFVLLIAGAVMLITWKFPQLALLVLVLFVAPEVAYQSGALGFIFLFAALPVLFAGLIDWRFGVGAFLTLFLAPIGISFAIPVFLALIFSLYVGIAVAVAGGLLISLFVTLGNLPVLGFLVGPGANGTPSLITGHSAALLPSLPIPYFSPVSIGTAYLNLLNPGASSFQVGVGGFAGIAIPLAEIGAWCLATWLAVYALKERERQTFTNLWRQSIFTGGLLAVATVGAFAAFNYLSIGSAVVVLFIPGMLAAMAGSLIIKDVFEAYFTSRLGASTVGTRVAEMAGLQKVTFEMVGGLHDVKADIKESMIIPLMRRDVTTRFKLEPPKGILLFGPPGCGKTMLMKALASELGVEMISIKCSDLMSKWYGESEGKVAELLKTARERAPCILFMDEIDSVAKRRDMYTADDVTPRLLSILLSEMDGIDKSVGVIVVGSTNKPDLIDPALMRPGRLDKIIYVPPPDFNERMEVLHVHLVGRPVEKGIDLAELAKKTERFSGADLANLVREAATIAVRREMTTGVRSPITMDDFRQVLPRIKPSISLRMLNDYEMMKLDYERKMHQSQRLERKIVVRWEDVGGLVDIKQALREYVELPLTRPELMESYKIKTGRGIMLFGPPGCGKTHIMRAAANELNVPMQIVNGPELVSALAGQSEAAIRDVLYRARENAPSIVFFDEIDALASKDSMKTPEVSRAVSQFLTEMDGLRPKDKVIVIATTNRPQTLDPALLRPGRFDKIFYVPPPDDTARQDIFRIHLKGVPVEGAINFGDLSGRTAGFSGADIAAVVDEAKLIALREQIAREIQPGGSKASAMGLFGGGSAPVPTETKVVGVKMENLLEAIGRTKSSITAETLQWATEFIQSYGTRT